jgi:cell division protein FtsB
LTGSGILCLAVGAFYAWNRFSQLEASLQVEKQSTEQLRGETKALHSQLEEMAAQLPESSVAPIPVPDSLAPPQRSQSTAPKPRTTSRRTVVSPAPVPTFDFKEFERQQAEQRRELWGYDPFNVREAANHREQEELKRKVDDLERKQRYGF